MAVEYGKALLVKVDITGSKTALLAQETGSVTMTGEPIEAYAKADYPVKKKLLGWVDWTIEVTHLLDLTDAAFDVLKAAALPATQASVTVQVAIGAKTYTGLAQVSNMQVGGEKGATATASCTLTGLAALTAA